MKRIILGGFGLLLVLAGPSSTALADSLTRSGCWLFNESPTKVTLCFSGSSRVTMSKTTTTTDHSISTCQFSGSYIKRGDAVTVTFQPNSGKCTNGARSPAWFVVCDFSGESLPCRGSTIVDGKTYEVGLTFE